MAYQRKTMDEWEIQQLGPSGWELACTELSRHRANMTAKDYRENMDYPVRIRKKRFKLADYNPSQIAAFREEARKGRFEGYEYRRIRRLQRHHDDQRRVQPNFIGPMYIGPC